MRQMILRARYLMKGLPPRVAIFVPRRARSSLSHGPGLKEALTTSNSTFFQREDEARSLNVPWIDRHTVEHDTPGLHRDPSSDIEWQLYSNENEHTSSPSLNAVGDDFMSVTLKEPPQDSSKRIANAYAELDNFFPGVSEHLTDFQEDRQLVKEFNVEGVQYPREFEGVDVRAQKEIADLQQQHAPTADQDTPGKTGVIYVRSEADDYLH